MAVRDRVEHVGMAPAGDGGDLRGRTLTKQPDGPRRLVGDEQVTGLELRRRDLYGDRIVAARPLADSGFRRIIRHETPRGTGPEPDLAPPSRTNRRSQSRWLPCRRLAVRDATAPHHCAEGAAPEVRKREGKLEVRLPQAP